jgi:hypothetical protein
MPAGRRCGIVGLTEKHRLPESETPMIAEYLLIQALIADRHREAERERTYRGGPIDRPARSARRQRAPRRRFTRKAGEAA